MYKAIFRNKFKSTFTSNCCPGWTDDRDKFRLSVISKNFWGKICNYILNKFQLYVKQDVEEMAGKRVTSASSPSITEGKCTRGVLPSVRPPPGVTQWRNPPEHRTQCLGDIAMYLPVRGVGTCFIILISSKILDFIESVYFWVSNFRLSTKRCSYLSLFVQLTCYIGGTFYTC